MSTLDDFLASIKEVKWFSGSGELPEVCLLFDTREGAQAARVGTRDYLRRAAWDAARMARRTPPWTDGGTALWDADTIAARSATRDVAWYTTRKVATCIVNDAASDAELLAGCIASWNDPTEVNTLYALKRWSVWTAGFGLLCDIRGTLYCYRRSYEYARGI